MIPDTSENTDSTYTTEKPKKMELREKLCIACDMLCYTDILVLVEELVDLVGYFKLNSAFTRFGPQLVQDVIRLGGKVFLDLKFHDIPNTVALHAQACTELGVQIFTVHGAGGSAMMQAAVRAAEESAVRMRSERPKIFAISAMTSISQEEMNREMSVPGLVSDYIVHIGSNAARAGLDGIVCSAADIPMVQSALPENFLYVTPGIRPGRKKMEGDDQQRIVSAAEALAAGSTLLVLGRSVYQAKNRRQAVQELFG